MESHVAYSLVDTRTHGLLLFFFFFAIVDTCVQVPTWTRAHGSWTYFLILS